MAVRSETRRVVRDYFAAWTGRDVRAARSHLADDLQFEGSIDRFDDAASYADALGAFTEMLTETRLLAEAYDGEFAALLYDCVTDSSAGTIRTSEHLHVVDGRIRSITLVFDATYLRHIANE